MLRFKSCARSCIESFVVLQVLPS